MIGKDNFNPRHPLKGGREGDTATPRGAVAELHRSKILAELQKYYVVEILDMSQLIIHNSKCALTINKHKRRNLQRGKELS